MNDINEGVLSRLLKQSVKAGGYILDRNKQGLWRLAGDGWRMEIRDEEMPWKVLGTIAEHLGRIPATGAMLVQRDGIQTMMDESWNWSETMIEMVNTGIWTSTEDVLLRDRGGIGLLATANTGILSALVTQSLLLSDGERWLSAIGTLSRLQVEMQLIDREQLRKDLGI